MIMSDKLMDTINNQLNISQNLLIANNVFIIILLLLIVVLIVLVLKGNRLVQNRANYLPERESKSPSKSFDDEIKDAMKAADDYVTMAGQHRRKIRNETVVVDEQKDRPALATSDDDPHHKYKLETEPKVQLHRLSGGETTATMTSESDDTAAAKSPRRQRRSPSNYVPPMRPYTRLAAATIADGKTMTAITDKEVSADDMLSDQFSDTLSKIDTIIDESFDELIQTVIDMNDMISVDDDEDDRHLSDY
ncbi:uncharacterized protein LOC128955574 [Oppia nitens]|uniref:uncharacterized protein LOC128955574 n=1 Tax=Oppia nitens TaxID=1686743 RepID=UPI0023DB4F92|nr:uncharacterized protein LOC128955574 [Oppia nitens]